MEMCSTRAAAYLLFFCLLVSQRSCASISKQGRPLLRFGESTAGDTGGSSSNRGVSCSDDDGKVVALLGILVLEVISGRLPFSEDHDLLVLWASSYLDGKRPLNSMADPVLRSSVPDKDLSALCDVVRLCVHTDKEKRSGMGEVARLMRGITALSPEQATPRDNPLWWAELEIASTVESA